MAELDRILAVVKAATGVDFTQYRDSTIGRRVERRAALRATAGLADYARLLEQEPAEVQALYQDLLINVTSFFRDPEVFETLQRVAFPALLGGKSAGTPIRFWVPGCSTGQEPYSLAIALLEFLEGRPESPPIQIFGTDLADEVVLARARAGRYPASIADEVSAERLARFFRRDGDDYVVRRELRELCVFARHDLTADPPFSRIDLISCRNVLIYMSPPLQQRVLPVFHYALNQSGFLVLGASEAVAGSFGDLFELVERAPKLYRKLDGAGKPARPLIPEAFFLRPPAAIPGKPAPAPPSTPPPAPPPAARGWRRWLGPWTDETPETDRLRQELTAAREFQQSLAEQQDAAIEELRSANEEILSGNEELQSTNEELRNAKQELQSANEELTAVNTQLAEQNAELVGLNSDLASLLGNLNLPVVLVGSDLTIRRFTPPAAPLLNLAGHDLGSALGTLRPAFDLPDLEALVTRVVETGQPLERSVPGAEGRWWALRIHPSKTPGEPARGALLLLVDITELRRSEETQARLAAIVESSEDAVIGKTLDGTITSWNQGAERLYGYRASEVVGMPITLLLPMGQPDEVPAALERLSRGERVDPFETHRRRKDGQLITVSLAISPVRDAAGRIVGVSAIARDITAARQAAEALRQSEARKAAILQTALDAMITMDHQGRVVEFNPAAVHMFGYREPEAVGRLLAELIVPPELRERHARGLAHYLATGEGPVLNRRIEITAIRSDGTRFPVELAITRISSGEPPFFTGAIRDITERKHAEQSLHEADRRKDEFLAVLSHELRNPLAPISSALAIMQLRPPAEPEVREARDMIERQLAHLVRLVDDLLDISRITRGRIELRRERVELATVLRSALESASHSIESAGHEMVVTLPDRPVLLEVDPVRIAQVVLNLLNNAAKFTPKGGRIELAATVEDADAVIVVRDSGVGIPSDALEDIFLIFAQGHPAVAHPHSGLGVGLALARSLVELHGGRLVARSAGPGQGSEFTVRIPLATTALPERRETQRKAMSPADPKLAVEPRRILVVDDNVDQAHGLALVLRLAGHEVREAHDAEGAVRAVAGFRPEVALLDIGLPGQSGYQLAQRLRAMPELAGLLLIAQTGWGSAEDRERSREAGFDHHLAKPIDLETLEGLLRRRT